MTPLRSVDFPLRNHTHVLVVAGSRAFGTHRADSDVDIKGVAIPPAAWFHGCMRQFDQATDTEAIATFVGDLQACERDAVAKSKLEGTVFDLRKFLRLASEANPNILEVLFCRDEEVRLITKLGRRLRDARGIFLSARARHTFAGYATAQLRRIETHRHWLLHPPEREPSRSDFDLPERTVAPTEQLAAASAAIRSKVESWDVDLSALAEPERLDLQARIANLIGEMQITHDDRWKASGRAIGIEENFLLLLDRERRYKSARAHWEQYRQWKDHRNAARAGAEARFGYDVKHGAHLYRLLKMCGEILLTGEVHVWRGDRDAHTIQAILRGEWPYDRLLGWAKDADAELSDLYSSRRFVVPVAPDPLLVDALCCELVERDLREA